MNYDFPEVMIVGGRWRSATVYTRDDDTRPIITCTTLDSLAEHLAMSTSMDGVRLSCASPVEGSHMAYCPKMWLRLKVDTHSYSSADRTPMSATPNTFKGMKN
ncbi:unnamed protein product [Penicillium camemberti]|uniref:Str. FM013 n=1 Tax=Penicillium camemberti (strain FM 013) TaxID=1429867 RepID=A0A0G4PKM2_PENC3|nr:unnamed protein product [Penicillium camemberti]